jgi:hypothetical protein
MEIEGWAKEDGFATERFVADLQRQMELRQSPSEATAVMHERSALRRSRSHAVVRPRAGGDYYDVD